MSGQPKINSYANLSNLAKKLRSDLAGVAVILLYAYNRTGKTRLSMDFQDFGKRKGSSDTLYFNAYTEDLFTWENDLENDEIRYLNLNKESKFFNGLDDLALDETIAKYLSRYADFEFYIEYEHWIVSFHKNKESDETIKISRGEQNIFIWCLFMALCERVIDGHVSYQWVNYLYIDDPISSLDDNNAIAVACDLAKLLRRAEDRDYGNDDPAPIKVVFSSHHSLFFNVMCNELKGLKHKRYFLHRPNSEGKYLLQATDDTPYFHHVVSLAELQRAADPTKGTLYTFHFNALRSIMEKTASFFGHKEISFCLQALNNEENEALFNRALNLLSHGKYAIHEPTLMAEDNQKLFRQILNEFLTHFQFDLPAILNAPKNQPPQAS